MSRPDHADKAWLRQPSIWPTIFDIAGTLAMLAAVITVMTMVALGWLE